MASTIRLDGRTDWNIFRDTFTGKLNRKFLRVGAVYRRLKQRRIGRARALELLAQRHTPKEMQSLRGTIDLWKAHPLPTMLP